MRVAIRFVIMASVLLATACGGPATAVSGTPTVAAPQNSPANLPVVTRVLATPIPTEPAATATKPASATSIADAQRVAESIGRDATNAMLRDTVWSLSGSSTRPTSKEIWIEGSALEWGGEIILWLHVQSASREDYFNEIARFGDFTEYGVAEAVMLAYNQRSKVAFSRVYVSYSFKEKPHSFFYWYAWSDIHASKGISDLALSKKAVETLANGPVPWIAGAK